MPPAIPVELRPHDPLWADEARETAARIRGAVGKAVIAVHHIGSTAIAHICAKPILDLVPVVVSLADLDRSRAAIEGLGYAWWGEYGLPGRRYCTLDDSQTGIRKVQLHCYERNDPEIARHLAFRDYLTAHPDIARRYETEKVRCRDLHPENSHAYGDCKSAWIREVERDALAYLEAQNRN